MRIILEATHFLLLLFYAVCVRSILRSFVVYFPEITHGHLSTYLSSRMTFFSFLFFQLLFFVLDDQTRNVVSMIEVSYLSGAGRRMVAVLGSYPSPSPSLDCERLRIAGEEVAEEECRDLNGAMTTVHDLVKKKSTKNIFAIKSFCRKLGGNC